MDHDVNVHDEESTTDPLKIRINSKRGVEEREWRRDGSV